MQHPSERAAMVTMTLQHFMQEPHYFAWAPRGQFPDHAGLDSETAIARVIFLELVALAILPCVKFPRSAGWRLLCFVHLFFVSSCWCVRISRLRSSKCTL